MDNQTVWETLEKISDLPTLPSVYFQVNKLLQDKQASIEKVARIIEVDPGMSSSVLRLVNSAFYGLSKKSSSISHAVMILGFNAVKNAMRCPPRPALLISIWRISGATASAWRFWAGNWRKEAAWPRPKTLLSQAFCTMPEKSFC